SKSMVNAHQNIVGTIKDTDGKKRRKTTIIRAFFYPSPHKQKSLPICGNPPNLRSAAYRFSLD
ncbi:MAG: hypothetical protein KDE48_18035, partial [Anaerolineales bacterium]|nr:hypothetical protein [Anaerolineales bacterium]